MKKIKAVAFDGWGTLFDEGVDSLRATAEMIVKELRLSMSGKDLLNLWTKYYLERVNSYSSNLRRTNISSLNKTFEVLNVSGDAEKYVSYLMDTRWSNSPLYPEVRDVLEAIDLPKCIISNIDNETLEGVLKRNGLTIDHTITSESAQAYKPNPIIFQKALKMLRCKNEELVYVGDSQKDDVAGAKNMGLIAVWINRRGEKLNKGVPLPDYEIKDLIGMLEILKELIR